MIEKFKEIAESLNDGKLQKTANSLYSKYKPTVSKELQKANEFAYELYFKSYSNESIKVCDLLGLEIFNGNHNLWTWIQSAILLKCWILLNSDDEKHKNEIEKNIEIINATMYFGNNELVKNTNSAVRKRRLNGVLLCYDNIANAIKENDKKSEIIYRIIHFKELLFIYFLGGSELFPLEKTLKEIQENEIIIKQFLQK